MIADFHGCSTWPKEILGNDTFLSFLNLLGYNTCHLNEGTPQLVWVEAKTSEGSTEESWKSLLHSLLFYCPHPWAYKAPFLLPPRQSPAFILTSFCSSSILGLDKVLFPVHFSWAQECYMSELLRSESVTCCLDRPYFPLSVFWDRVQLCTSRLDLTSLPSGETAGVYIVPNSNYIVDIEENFPNIVPVTSLHDSFFPLHSDYFHSFFLSEFSLG